VVARDAVLRTGALALLVHGAKRDVEVLRQDRI
jgi:hypothetical protein